MIVGSIWDVRTTEPAAAEFNAYRTLNSGDWIPAYIYDSVKADPGPVLPQAALGYYERVGMRNVCDAVNEPMLSILVPTSPFPGTGFTVMIRQRDALDLNMTVDQAVQYLVSCGVVVPFVQQSCEEQGDRPRAEIAADPRRRLPQPMPSGTLD